MSEQNVRQERRVDRLVMPPALLDLLRFMCATWAEIDAWAYEYCDSDALAHYPVVQGTTNQIGLKRIGEQGYDPRALRTAVEWMLRHNSELRRVGAGDENHE